MDFVGGICCPSTILSYAWECWNVEAKVEEEQASTGRLCFVLIPHMRVRRSFQTYARHATQQPELYSQKQNHGVCCVPDNPACYFPKGHSNEMTIVSFR